MIVIVLLNTLIAQVSDTYTKVLSTAEGVHLFYQCAYIAKLEERKSLCIQLCCSCFASVSLLHDSLSQLCGTKDALYCWGANVTPALLII